MNEDERITVTGGQDDVLNDDTDVDADASLVVTNISTLMVTVTLLLQVLPIAMAQP